MRFITTILLFVCIYSTYIPTTSNFKSNSKTVVQQTNNDTKSSITVSHCGTFTTPCLRMQGAFRIHKVVLHGSIKSNPTKMTRIHRIHQDNCKKLLYNKVIYKYSLKNAGGNKYSTKITDIKLHFTQGLIDSSGCTNVKVGEEVSVKKAKCYVNGEDRLLTYKEQIGQKGHTVIEYTDKGIKVDKASYLSENEEGCRMATSLIVIIVIASIIVIILIVFAIIKYILSYQNKLLKKTTK